MNLTDSDLRRFWAKVALPDENGCMLWLAGIGPTHGYARFKINDREGRASRVSLQIAVGPPPDEYAQAAHSCRNRHCVAPAHLRWATQAENQADRLSDGTHNRGERNGNALLTWEKVRDIREQAAEGVPLGRIATAYGVHCSVISKIASGKRWVPRDDR